MNKSLLAIVCFVMAVSAAVAAAPEPLPAYDASLSAPAGANRKPDLANAPTLRAGLVSSARKLLPSLGGLRSEYDERLQLATFLWADAANKPATLLPLKIEALRESAARNHLLQQSGPLRLSRQGIADARLVSLRDTGAGPIVARFAQRKNRLEVFNRGLNVMMDRDMRLIATSGYFAAIDDSVPTVSSRAAALDTFRIAPERALALAFADLAKGQTLSDGAFSAKAAVDEFTHYTVLSSSGNLRLIGEQRLRKMYFPLEGRLIPAYYIELDARTADEADESAYSFMISADDGRVLFRKNLINDAHSYRAYADSSGMFQPFDSPLGNALEPTPATASSPFLTRTAAATSLVTLNQGPISGSNPWLANGATVTTGNNVDAYLDLAAPDGFTAATSDARAPVSSAGAFDYPYTPDANPATATQRNFAVVHLFYVNNWLHDWWYGNGFNEAAGNAQSNNYGRGGIGGDSIRAEAQDYSSRNNANMFTPADGGRPRMQMYRFNGNSADIDGSVDTQVIAHEWFHYVSNRLVGNASGLLGSQGLGMGEGWSDFSALMLTVRPEDRLASGNEQLQGAYPIAYYATRNNYFGIRRAPYSTSFSIFPMTFRHISNGVPLPTSAPVAGDLSGSNNAQVHRTGEIWCNALWEVYVSLLNDPRYSFVQAQERMKNYIIAGLMMTPNVPTMTEARNAILAAAHATDAADFSLVNAAFARRGLGVAAVAPDRYDDNNANAIEDYSSDLAGRFSGQAALNTAYHNGGIGDLDNDGILDPGDTALLTLTITSDGTADITSPIVVNLSSASDLTFQNDGQLVFPASASTPIAIGNSRSATMQVVLNSAAQLAQTVTLNLDYPQVGPTAAAVIEPAAQVYTLAVNADVTAHLRSSDDLEQPLTIARDWTTTLTGIGRNWQLVDADSTFHSGKLWYVPDNSVTSDARLSTLPIAVSSADDFSLSFQHYYSFENPFDGGVIEISSDGGNTWTDIVAAGAVFTSGRGYNGTISSAGRSGFIGSNASLNGGLLEPVTISFGGAYAGQTIRLRFRQLTDAGVGAYGWAIDNIGFGGVSVPVFSATGANPGISIDDLTFSEGNNGTTAAIFTVSRAGVTSGPASVSYASADGSASAPGDYSAASGTLSFGTGEIAKTVTVIVNGDTAIESDETFFINLGNPAGAVIADAQGRATIVNDDLAPPPSTLGISDASVVERNSGTANATFVVTRSGDTSGAASVNYATANGSATAPADYLTTSGTLSFTSGQVSKSLIVTVNGDTSVEPDDTFAVNLQDAVGASIADGQGVATITNDDQALLRINDISVAEGNGSGTFARSFTITRSGGVPTGNVTVNYATADGTAVAGVSPAGDYVATSGTLSFTPSETRKTFTVLVNRDNLIEGNETFLVNLGGAVGAGIADAQGVATITNDDADAVLRINDISVAEGNGAGTLVRKFTVTRSGGVPAGNITVNYATADGTALAGTAPAGDYRATSGTLTLLASEASKTLSVQINRDRMIESDETFFIDLSDALGAVIADDRGVGSIVNDD